MRAELESLRRRHTSALELMGERDEEVNISEVLFSSKFSAWAIKDNHIFPFIRFHNRRVQIVFRGFHVIHCLSCIDPNAM